MKSERTFAPDRIAVRARTRSLAGALMAAVATLTLSGCTGTVEDKLDELMPAKEPLYKGAKRLPPLEIPPDLTSNTIRDSLDVPAGGSATYSEYRQATNQPVARRSTAGVLPDFNDVHLQRAGKERWLVVDRPPEEVYAEVRDYWASEGLAIVSEDPAAGIIETDWAEKRANLRSGFLAGLFDRISSAAYGPAYRDKFRCRLEQGREPGTTEIFVSHRGAEEVTVKGPQNSPHEREDSRRWIPRDPDPELVADVLARMRVFLGTGSLPEGPQVAATQTQDQRRAERAHLVKDGNGGSMLALNDDFPRAWRRTGLALDRVGFTVEDRDRDRGVYYVRYVDPEKELGNKDDGFFSRLKFWDNDEEEVDREYLVSVVNTSNATQVVVLDKDGAPERTGTGERILGLLHEQLK
ncbi:MAG: outer membrane protein assembly factor BamC [Gammaproteobacteria bacterium]